MRSVSRVGQQALEIVRLAGWRRVGARERRSCRRICWGRAGDAANSGLNGREIGEALRFALVETQLPVKPETVRPMGPAERIGEGPRGASFLREGRERAIGGIVAGILPHPQATVRIAKRESIHVRNDTEPI